MNWHLIVDTLARLLIVFTFFKSGIRNLLNPQPVIGMISGQKWPFPKIIFAFVVLIQIVAPLLIVGHIFAAFAAIALFLFTLLCNLFFCTYWKMAGNTRTLTGFLFDANIAIMGGLLFIAIQ